MEIEKSWLQTQMLNKFFLCITIFSSNVFSCLELNKLNLYHPDTKTISLDYIQTFEASNKSVIKGKIYFDKPDLFKILTIEPSKTDLIVNGKDVYRTDYELNETIKYDLLKIESQVPAFVLLKTKKNLCNFLRESKNSDFINAIQIVSDDEKLKRISYKDQFGVKTVIRFFKIKINEKIDKKMFEFNQESNLIILN